MGFAPASQYYWRAALVICICSWSSRSVPGSNPYSTYEHYFKHCVLYWCLNMNSTRQQLNPAMKAANAGAGPATSDPTRDKLLDVAGRIFADRGYHAATIREICVAAGANIAAVNYHFGDKLGLYTEVVQQSHAHGRTRGHAERPRSARRRRRSSCGRSSGCACAASAGKTGRTGTSASWSTRLAQPTPALRQLINKVGRPLFERMLELIGGMIGLPAERRQDAAVRDQRDGADSGLCLLACRC